MNETQTRLCVIHDLNNLARQLDAGAEVQGRIVQCIDNQIYLLRVRGFNIITESSYPFTQFEEVRLIVKSVSPQFVFQLKPVSHVGGTGVYA